MFDSFSKESLRKKLQERRSITLFKEVAKMKDIDKRMLSSLLLLFHKEEYTIPAATLIRKEVCSFLNSFFS